MTGSVLFWIPANANFRGAINNGQDRTCFLIGLKFVACYRATSLQIQNSPKGLVLEALSGLLLGLSFGIRRALLSISLLEEVQMFTS